jgi:hypothetical protein
MFALAAGVLFVALGCANAWQQLGGFYPLGPSKDEWG